MNEWLCLSHISEVEWQVCTVSETTPCSRPARWINSSNLGGGWDPLNSDRLEERGPLGQALFSRRKEKESLYSAIIIAVNHCSPQHPLPSAQSVYWKARPYFQHPGHGELSSLAEGKVVKATCQGLGEKSCGSWVNGGGQQLRLPHG